MYTRRLKNIDILTLQVDVGRFAMAGRYAEIKKTFVSCVFNVRYVTAVSKGVFPSPILRIYSLSHKLKTTSSKRKNLFAN